MTDHMVWLDIETTGLDPVGDYLLEVGVVVTDADLRELGRYRVVVREAPIEDLWARVEATPAVLRMHAQSGLMSDVEAEGHEARTSESWLLSSLEGRLGGTAVAFGPMCGSSVHFDRAFLARHMPTLEAKFHYRNVDVSGIREAVKLWAPHVMDDAPVDQKLHRALPDLDDTLALARHLRRRLFLREVAA